MNKTAAHRLIVKVASIISKKATPDSLGTVEPISGPNYLDRNTTRIYENNGPAMANLYSGIVNNMPMAAGAAIGSYLNNGTQRNRNRAIAAISQGVPGGVYSSRLMAPTTAGAGVTPMGTVPGGAAAPKMHNKLDTRPGISQNPVMNKMWQDAYNRHN